MSSENLFEIKKNVEHLEQGFEYAYGPLNKSEDTRLFEQIVEDIITDRRSELEGAKAAKPKIETRVENGIMYVNRNGQETNINQLLENVDLNHVKLSSKSLEEYGYLYESDPILKSTVPSRNQFEERLKKADDHQKVSLGKLSYAEKVAINLYTSNDNYTNMNGILRGTTAPKDFGKYLMDIAVSSQALNSLPSIELPIVSRMQDVYGLDKMMEMQANHEIEETKGFISTAYNTPWAFGSSVEIIYTNVRGVSVAALSAYPEEEEYLIPPSTQIKYTGHKIINGRHVFTAEGANVLLDTKRQMSPAEKLEKKVNDFQDTCQEMVNQLSKVLEDDNLKNQIGDKYAKELKEKFVTVKENFQPQGNAQDAVAKLQKNLGELNKWCQEKADASSEPKWKNNLKHIGQIISSYAQAVFAKTPEDREKHKLNAKQATKELWHGKQVAEELKNKKEVIGKFTAKVNEKRSQAGLGRQR